MERQPLAEWVRERDDPKIAHTKPEALDDITILDLSYNSYAGCYCTSLLSELGAEVVRIEPPEGDFLRTCTPDGLLYKKEGLTYLSEGRNKFHVTLNLKDRKGQGDAQGLAAQADVLVETYNPGVMDEWGIGYEQLKEINPRLIFASISPWGQFGPKSHSTMPDYENITQARASIQYATGEMLPEGKTYDEYPGRFPPRAAPGLAGPRREHSCPSASWPLCTIGIARVKDRRWTWLLLRHTPTLMIGAS